MENRQCSGMNSLLVTVYREILTLFSPNSGSSSKTLGGRLSVACVGAPPELLAVSLTRVSARSGKRVGWVHDVCHMGSLAARSSRTCSKRKDAKMIHLPNFDLILPA